VVPWTSTTKFINNKFHNRKKMANNNCHLWKWLQKHMIPKCFQLALSRDNLKPKGQEQLISFMIEVLLHPEGGQLKIQRVKPEEVTVSIHLEVIIQHNGTPWTISCLTMLVHSNCWSHFSSGWYTISLKRKCKISCIYYLRKTGISWYRKSIYPTSK